MSEFSEQSKKIVDTLLGRNLPERAGATWIVQERRRAEQKLDELSKEEKEKISTYLAERLPYETDDNKMWIVSALAIINDPKTIGKVAGCIDGEKNHWVRFWAVVSLAKAKPKDLEKYLIKASKDADPRPRSAALRLLIVNGYKNKKEHLEKFLEMGKSNDWVERRMMCRVIRDDVSEKPFEEFTEEKVFKILSWLLEKERIIDIQRQAAYAMGSMKHKAKEAIQLLSLQLKKNRSDIVRRCCVDAMGQLKRVEAKYPLFLALQDTDAEIRTRSANALKKVLGKDESVKFIVKEFLSEDIPSSEYGRNIFNALRNIDETKSSIALAEKLQHPDPNIRQRARDALTKLGGEEAVRILHVERSAMLQQYSQLLEESDTEVIDQFNRMMRQARLTFRMSMVMHAIIFGIGIVILIASMFVALSEGFSTFERFVGSAGAVGSLGVLLLLFYKDPLKNINKSFTDLVKVDVVFSGFVRQIRQIDATFKQLFLRSSLFGIDDLKLTVEQIQSSVKTALQEVKCYLDRKEDS